MRQDLCGRQELVERERAMEKCVERSDIHTGIDNIFRLHTGGVPSRMPPRQLKLL